MGVSETYSSFLASHSAKLLCLVVLPGDNVPNQVAVAGAGAGEQSFK